MISFFRKLFCNHKDWIEKKVIVVSPTLGTIKNFSENLTNRIVNGETTIIYECPKCGKLTTISSWGVPK